MSQGSESLFADRFPNLGACRKCFVDCGECPDQIRSVVAKADHNLANLEACILRRTQLEEALRATWGYMLVRDKSGFKPWVDSMRERLGL